MTLRSTDLFLFPRSEKAIFVSRPNRFLLRAHRSDGTLVEAHVPDPGRLIELLYPGNEILIIPAPPGTARRTKWSLLAAGDQTGWILVNTTFHRLIAEKLFRSEFSPVGPVKQFRAEVKSPAGHSRFDFLVNGNTWVEIKGCTLKKGNRALFPDAPTSRGVKHLKELTELARNKKDTAVIFLVFVRDVNCFCPDRTTDPAFADALDAAVSSGVNVYPIQISFNGETAEYTGSLELVTD